MLAEHRTNLLEMWLAVHTTYGGDIDPLVEHLVILLWISQSLLFLPTPNCSQQMAILGADSPSGGEWNESFVSHLCWVSWALHANNESNRAGVWIQHPPFSATLFFFFFFWSHHSACGIFIPQSEIEPWPMAMKAASPNHWTTREFPSSGFFWIKAFNCWGPVVFVKN